MEPRYARAHVYTAVAYYQQGDTPQALGELQRAQELDDKDPLPYFLRAMIDTDRLRPADAIDSARAALRRMPYLKSLNQLANDQQGSANLGQAFAFMGMEDWAASYAQESYSPYWAGSHLFLADRYAGLFTKNAELFQGLLADPTVFGAGNRFKQLVAAPASHAARRCATHNPTTSRAGARNWS
jgi:tetratricopeptide (TPR) repeat protein